MFKPMMLLRPIMKVLHPNEVDCIDTRQLSSDYLEGNLSPTKLAAIQNHLSKCGPCQAFVGTLSSTIGALGRLPGINAPSALKQSLLERMHREN